jgi:hypothetical protein
LSNCILFNNLDISGNLPAALEHLLINTSMLDDRMYMDSSWKFVLNIFNDKVTQVFPQTKVLVKIWYFVK